MQSQGLEGLQWVLQGAANSGRKSLWRVSTHHLAAGQLQWLTLKAGQWLSVQRGSLISVPAAPPMVWLDGLWAGAGVMDSRQQRVCAEGDVQAVVADGAWCLSAEAGGATVCVWQKATWWQRWRHAKRAELGVQHGAPLHEIHLAVSAHRAKSQPNLVCV